MGGWRGRSLLLGLLLLISGALLPGDAEGQTSGPPTDPRVAPTIPLLLKSSDSPDWTVSSGVSTSEAPGHEVTEQPPPLVTPTSDNGASNVTTAPRDVTGAGDPSRMSPVTDHDTTGTDATQPPPTTQLPSTAHNTTAAETSSLLLTLRATAITQLGDDSTPYTTTSVPIHFTGGMSTIVATVTSPATQSSSTTATPHTTRAELQQEPSVLEVGEEKDPTSYHSRNNSNPLFVMIVSVFTVMVVMAVVVVGFHRYKKKNSRTEFRRLQDLPMDDMMEDTPLSLYSY